MTSHSADLPRPDVAVVGLGRPFTWLAGGWRDLWRRPAASLFYGLAVALCGGAILLTTARLPYLFTAAVSGFLLVAPLLATGLYDLSRGYERGEPVSLGESMQAWRRNASPMLAFGMLALLAGTVWQVVSLILVAVFYRGGAGEPLALILDILRDPQYMLLFVTYVGSGGVLAGLMFAVSVVAMPMLLDRRCDLICAVLTSLAAVAENPLPLALWAALIMTLTAIGFATALVGLVVVLPWLGHASWHAYRDLVP